MMILFYLHAWIFRIWVTDRWVEAVGRGTDEEDGL